MIARDIGSRGERIDEQGLKVAYILNRFPYLTETFIMREMCWLREQGIEIQIFSLLPPKPTPVHEEAKALLSHTQYAPFFSRLVIKAQLHFLLRAPCRYLMAIARVVWQTYREPTALARALALFPKSVYFARQIQEMRIEHVHAHYVWLGGLAAGIAADLVGVTFTIHPHAFDLFRRNQRDVRVQLENASRVVTVSDYHRKYIAALCPHIHPEHIEVVHCGIDLGRFKVMARHAGGRPVCILSVGSHVEKKGHEYLIDACARLAELGLEFQCNIVGDGPRQAALRARIDQHGLQDRVTLLGALEQTQVVELYHQSDIFALPCVVANNGDRDGLPVVLIEAMACGLPVVTTPMTGIPELVHDGTTGLIVQQRDVSGLTSALARLIADRPLREQLGRDARRAVEEGFQIQPNVSKLATIFREVRGQHKKARVNTSAASRTDAMCQQEAHLN